jgi:hypothetical protein
MNTSLPAGAPQVTSPITGTIVRWRIKTGASGDGTLKLRVIAPAGGVMFSGAGTGATETTPTTAGTTTFSAQLPIQAGEYLGVDSSDNGQLPALATSQTGANVGSFNPPLADGGSAASPSSAPAGWELLVNADVAALPTSSVTVPACSKGGQLAATVTADPDPAVAAKAIHFRVDGASEQAISTSGSPGSATITVPEGSHTLEYWGEDSVGALESSHHTASVLVDTIAPVVMITSDQGKTIYPPGAVASISVAASDSGSGLQSDPSGMAELLPTSVTGTYTVTRTAVDNCGNTSAAPFTYTVTNTVAKPPSAQNAKITGLAPHPRSFVAASHGASIARRTGTEIGYTDSQSATTTFTVQRPEPGVRRGGRCVKPSRSHLTDKRCTRYAAVGSFRHLDVAGANRLHFTGRLNGRKLPPGLYRLRAVARGASGKPGPTAFTKFRVLP